MTGRHVAIRPTTHRVGRIMAAATTTTVTTGLWGSLMMTPNVVIMQPIRSTSTAAQGQSLIIEADEGSTVSRDALAATSRADLDAMRAEHAAETEHDQTQAEHDQTQAEHIEHTPTHTETRPKHIAATAHDQTHTAVSGRDPEAFAQPAASRSGEAITAYPQQHDGIVPYSAIVYPDTGLIVYPDTGLIVYPDTGLIVYPDTGLQHDDLIYDDLIYGDIIDFLDWDDFLSGGLSV